MGRRGARMEEMPATWRGPHGRQLRVTKAIVKVLVRAGNRPFPDRDKWIVRCGNSPRGCRGIIGFPNGRDVALSPHLPGSRVGAVEPGVWCMTHPNRYRGNRTTGYFVLDERGRRGRGDTRIGRRPLPRSMDPEFELGPLYDTDFDGDDELDSDLLRHDVDSDWAYDDRAVTPPKRDRPNRGVVGQFPIPPCIIFCPMCKMPNYVEPPNAEPPRLADPFYGF